jgi:hypothetical protein
MLQWALAGPDKHGFKVADMRADTFRVSLQNTTDALADPHVYRRYASEGERGYGETDEDLGKWYLLLPDGTVRYKTAEEREPNLDHVV